MHCRIREGSALKDDERCNPDVRRKCSSRTDLSTPLVVKIAHYAGFIPPGRVLILLRSLTE